MRWGNKSPVNSSNSVYSIYFKINYRNDPMHNFSSWIPSLNHEAGMYLLPAVRQDYSLCSDSNSVSTN